MKQSQNRIEIPKILIPNLKEPSKEDTNQNQKLLQELLHPYKTPIQNIPKQPKKSFNKYYNNLKNTYILTLTHNRVHYLTQSITSLLKQDGLKELNFVISQDGEDLQITKQIFTWKTLLTQKFNKFSHIKKKHDDGLVKSKNIAAHYKFALDNIFYTQKADKVIVLEGKKT
jgi:hypothetical protein